MKAKIREKAMNDELLSSPLLAKEIDVELANRKITTSLAGSSTSDSESTGSEKKISITSGYLTVLLPLLLMYISNQWSRYSLSYLVDFSESASAFKAMNIDIGFNQVQYGTLASVAFTALFAVASLIAGNLADKTDRKKLTLAACTLWSAATVATAFSVNYEQVVAARVIMGLMCAFATPCGYTLIRDYFPEERRAFVSSLYGAGVYMGGALASLSILLDNNFGWRVTMETIAAYGVVASVIALLVLPGDSRANEINEPLPELASDSLEAVEAQGSILSDALSVLSSTRIQLLFLASFLRFCAGLSIGVWGAPYFKMTFPDDAQTYGVVNALIVSVCGVTSGVAGGALADKAAQSAGTFGFDSSAGKLAIPVVGSLLAVPAWYFCVNADTFEAAMAWLAVEYLLAECWFGPTVAVLQSNVKSDKGGTAQGMFTLVGAFANFAPALLGSLYGSQVGAGESSSSYLSLLLAIAVCGGYSLSALTFYLSARAMGEIEKAP